ncbi:shikimate kinase [Candidatus Pacearchaeota archaeon]|nr:shikimate kinase [Candidatus Pacearchaeota archaeon]
MNIVLIGMPYSGKSTLGKKLAKKLSMNFVDTDRYIEELERIKLTEIFKERGERGFKEIEEKRILELEFDNSVIASGGSVVLSPGIMEHLKKNAVIIYLKISFEELEKRIKDINSRGIVGFRGNLKEVFEFRAPFYERYADKVVEVNKETLNYIVNFIKNKV